MAASYGGPGTPLPAFNPVTWALGYQARQFGVAGPSVAEALADPPANMTTAIANVEDAYITGITGAQTTEPYPEYEQ
jgi:hypothetical protein